MEQKLPYYMAYPLPFLYDDERMQRRDYEYVKSLYPGTVKRLIPYIEREFDRLAYEGSMLYDEYPDPLQLRLMCRRIYDQAAEEETPGEWLKNLIQVMACQELCHRRQERRGRRRYF